MAERTFVMTKPDGVGRRLIGEISASMVAFDYTGNRIYTGNADTFQYQQSSGVLINAIELKNSNGRDLASGAYMAVITVELSGENSDKITHKTMIGVQK